jgi:hypothetical protein
MIPVGFEVGDRSMSALQFQRALQKLDAWSANSDGISFVITFESQSDSGFHGRTGYLASWRPDHLNRLAIKVIGSPFKTFENAEEACNAMLRHLNEATHS